MREELSDAVEINDRLGDWLSEGVRLVRRPLVVEEGLKVEEIVRNTLGELLLAKERLSELLFDIVEVEEGLVVHVGLPL